MTLTAKDVAQITKLLEDSSFDELDLEIDGVKLSLRRGGSSAAPIESSAPPAAAGAPAGAASRPAAPAAPTPSTADPAFRDVPAPLLGTFYRAPKPGAPPFVEVGSAVEEQTIIGIIEVMKLMNTVRAGVSGRVAQILARDGALVEYGETLMRVGKTG